MIEHNGHMSSTAPVALTIAGSDPSGGAGVQADLKTFHQHGVYGASAITLVTVQNTLGVSAVSTLDPSLVVAQIEAVLNDLEVHAIKTGALGNEAIITAVAQCLKKHRHIFVIVDPVMRSKNGNPLLDPRAVSALRDELLPRADLVTPNVPEAEALAELRCHDESAAISAAHRIRQSGVRAVLIKGGHMVGGRCTDVLVEPDGTVFTHTLDRIETKHTHGTGCTLSAAITANIAKGLALRDAYVHARGYLQRALAHGPGCKGHGIGPVNHFVHAGD
jgi:hydroxymethylpyrimidine/phosphomethylpyrimidine kinase